MSKLDRKDIKIFGNTAPVADLRQFGSTREGAPVTSTDPDILQGLSNYEDAWNEGIVASLNIPPLEEFNTLQYLSSRELAYIQQVGIPEFSLTTTYFANKSIVRTPEDSTLYKSAVDDNLGNDIVGVAAYNAGTSYDTDDLAADTNGDIYRSLSDSNMGNALSNPTFWELTWIFLGDLENLKNLAQATETLAGIAEIATQAEVGAGTDDLRIITAAKLLGLFGTSSQSANPGYARIPINIGGAFDEIIIQWGEQSVSGDTVTTDNLGLTYPNAHLQAYASSGNTGVSEHLRLGANPISLTQIQLINSDSLTHIMRWFSIGY